MAMEVSLGYKLLLVTVLLPCLANSALWQLCEQLDFYDQFHQLFDCLIYDEYGCWCGPGGSGTPVDGVDSCCMIHDHCYDKVLAAGCNPYLDIYRWKNGTCLDAPENCRGQLCLCDKAIGTCVSKNKYNWRYYGWRLWHRCDNGLKGFVTSKVKAPHVHSDFFKNDAQASNKAVKFDKEPHYVPDD